MTAARDALCVALDGSDRRWILDTGRALAGVVGWLKVGLEAFAAHGPDLARQVAALDCRLFLDLKLHDIPTTVRRAAAGCAATGADMLTVHAAGGLAMLEAAVAGVRDECPNRPPKVVAVTLLTSLDRRALDQLGIARDPEETALRWARMASACGIDGVVVAAGEAAAIRAGCPPGTLIVTPGIRASEQVDDQRRTASPGEAIRQGADILVVGRPITRAPSPLDAAHSMLREIAAALGVV